MSTLDGDKDRSATQQLQEQNEDQQPLIGQEPGHRSSEDEDATALASTSESAWRTLFLYVAAFGRTV